MQPRPLLRNTLSTITSRNCSQRSTWSSPSRILEKPGPCACTRGLPRYRSTVAVPPKIRLRPQLSSTAAPTSPPPGIDRDRLARDAGLEERLGHAIRRPRLLRTGLEDQADLQRDDRQPQRVHARRIRRQHQADDRALRLIADRHAALFAVAGATSTSSARPRVSDVEDAAHLGEHERVLLHVRAAHALGQAGAAPTARARTRRASACRRPSAASRSCRARPPCRRGRSDRRSESRAAPRARAAALRMSRWISPPLARLTLAIGSPVAKCTTCRRRCSCRAGPSGEREYEAC